MGFQDCASLMFMRAIRQNSRWSRVTVLMWLSVWMLVVPLFHVHPEADHLHGTAGHVHGGTVHTVWSGDLACEFGSHEKAAPTGIALSKHSPQGRHDHPEFGFSLLNDSNDRKSFKLFGTQALFAAGAVVPILQGCNSAAQELASDAPSRLFLHDRPSRAPPILLL